MDKNVLKLIKAELKDDMKQRGFKTEGTWYMRFANSEVYQVINFQGSMFGGKFTVNFGSLPSLVGNTAAKTDDYTSRLGPLVYGYDYWWDYSEKSASEMAENIRKIILPIFDACATYQGLFDFVKPILINDEYDRNNTNTPAVTVYRSYGDETWVKILVRLNEYEYCKEMLHNRINLFSEIIENERKEYEAKKASETDPNKIKTLDIEMKERENNRLKRIDEYRSYLTPLENGDLSDMLAEIKENENKSADALVKYFVKLQDGKIPKGKQ